MSFGKVKTRIALVTLLGAAVTVSPYATAGTPVNSKPSSNADAIAQESTRLKAERVEGREKTTTLADLKEQGLKDGPFVLDYENGRPKVRGEVVAGKREGLWRFWDDKGAPFQDIPFAKGAIQGEVKAYFPDGKLKLTTEYVQGVEEGRSRMWHSNGRLKIDASNKAGKLEGRYQAWGNNGQPLLDCNYVADILEGAYKAWDEKGKLTMDVVYEKGEIKPTAP